jgi:hypothetical protein
MSEIFRFEITNEASVFNALPLMLDGDGRLVVFLYMGGASQDSLTCTLIYKRFLFSFSNNFPFSYKYLFGQL